MKSETRRFKVRLEVVKVSEVDVTINCDSAQPDYAWEYLAIENAKLQDDWRPYGQNFKAELI